jgi:ADP-ribose pyrophosphatase
MKKFLLLTLLYCQYICGNQSLEEYFSYVKQLNLPNGSFKEGEIEIVTDPTEISLIQKVQEKRLLQKGFSADKAAEFSRVGIVNEDQYWIWLRDAVYFPRGVPGTYDRLLWRSELKEKFPGVAILPILPSGQIILILNYRHATRSWELELPRGRIESQETLREAACRELKEETGLIASSMVFLGEVTTDTGVHSSVIPIFIGKISSQGDSNPEYSEAIARIIAFTKEEIKEGLVQGYLEISIQGTKKQIPLRDAFLTFALFQAECRKLL